MGFTGDPVWLEDVLRRDLGDRLVVHDAWQDYGTGGTMGALWGVTLHHTGNVNERWEVIRDGVLQPSGWLPGPLSQGLITPDGKFHLVAVGPCNHAGTGKYGSLVDGNGTSIGIECAYAGAGPWPRPQIITMRDSVAAILRRLGYRSDRVCSHQEYALPRGRKVDPGNLSMDWFRGEVQKDLDGFVFPGEALSTPPPFTYPSPDEMLKQIWEQLFGPQAGGWPFLGKTADGLRNKYTVEAIDDLHRTWVRERGRTP